MTKILTLIYKCIDKQNLSFTTEKIGQEDKFWITGPVNFLKFAHKSTIIQGHSVMNH